MKPDSTSLHLVLHMQIQDNLTYLNNKFKEKT